MFEKIKSLEYSKLSSWSISDLAETYMYRFLQKNIYTSEYKKYIRDSNIFPAENNTDENYEALFAEYSGLRFNILNSNDFSITYDILYTATRKFITTKEYFFLQREYDKCISSIIPYIEKLDTRVYCFINNNPILRLVRVKDVEMSINSRASEIINYFSREDNISHNEYEIHIYASNEGILRIIYKNIENNFQQYYLFNFQLLEKYSHSIYSYLLRNLYTNNVTKKNSIYSITKEKIANLNILLANY